MTQYIDKFAALAEIENIKSIEFNEGTPSDNYACMALDMVIETLDTLEVKEADLETDVEREYVNCYIDIFDKKFPIMPTLKGQYLHDYKNFLNTCQQIFGLKWWGMHPTQAILFEKLSLLWAAWGAEHLQIGQAHGEFDTPKVKEVDFEKEWKDYFKYRGDVATVNIKHLAKHFFELGMSVSNKTQKGEQQ